MSSPFFERLLDRPVAVSMLYGVLIVGGILAYLRLPLELAPEKEYPRLSVDSYWGQTSPETMEMLITSPIEEIANTVQGVRKVSSTSSEGTSSVDIEFEDQTDMNFARLELSEKLAAFAENLSPGVSPPTISRYVPRDLRNLQGFLSYSLSGGQTAQFVRKYAEEKIVLTLLSIKGVDNVRIMGGERRELQVVLDGEKMLALGLKSQTVAAKLRELEYNRPVGLLKEQGGSVIVSVRNSTSSMAELESQIVGILPNGTPIRLRDIGTVRDGLSEAMTISRINGTPSITLNISKEQGVSTLRLADGVFAKLHELEPDFPTGFKLIKESDKSEQLRKDLANLYQEIIISLLCIGLILTIFLRSLKSSALVLSSIVFSLAGTFLIFWMVGIGLNLLTLAGLVLGFGRLVDDSIVVLDNIYRRHDLGLQEHLVSNPGTGYRGFGRSEVALAVREIALPVVASTITTVGALVPLEFLPRELKPYFLDFGIAVGTSLLMSLLVSFTLIPTVTHRISLEPFRIGALEWIGEKGTNAYRRILRAALRHKKIVFLLTLWLFGLPVWLLPERIDSESTLASIYNRTIGSDTYKEIKPYVNYALGGTSYLFFDKVPRGEIWTYREPTYLSVSISFPQGTEMERFDAIARSVEEHAMRYSSGVSKVMTTVAERRAYVKIDIADSAAMTALPYELKNELTLFAAQTGGASIGVSGFGPGFYSGGSGGSVNYHVNILGYNYVRVREIAEEMRDRLVRNPRVADMSLEGYSWWGVEYDLFVTVDRDTIARHGLTVQEVIYSIRDLTRGEVTQSTLNIDGERVPYIVKLKGYRSFSVDDLRKAVLTNDAGERVRLSGLIRIEEKKVPGEITRENQQYVRTVGFEYKGPYQYGDKYLDQTLKSMSLPSGYQFDRSYRYFRFREEQEISLLLIALLAFVVVFMVTASLYESLVKPFVVILAIPLSLIGLFLIFYLLDVPFGRGGYASVVLLIGIVVTNSVVLVDYMGKRLQGDHRTLEVLVEAASTRLRPILMTTLTTIGGMIPLLLMQDKMAIWYSLAVGTIGGLTSSMLLTLIVVPLVYARIYKITHHINPENC